MTFKQFHIHSLIQESIDAQGFTEPTPVQAKAIPEALKGRDIRACAQTGTGKTVAFVIPILNQLIQHPTSQSLVVVPTRELGSQVLKVFNQVGRIMKVKCALLVGGMKIGKQFRQIENGAEVIVATPGRLKDHLNRGSLKLDGIKIFVLDEADRMLDMGFLPDIKKILSHLPAKRQTLLFSATFPPQIQKLTAQFQHNPVTVNLAPSTPAQTVTQILYRVPNNQKDSLLLHLIKNEKPGSTIIFCRTKRRVNRLAKTLKHLKQSVDSLHSDKSQGQRNRVLSGFSKKEIQLLVATDIASRGLDMKEITHVINYDVPTHPEDYVHRIGRTGRAKATGDAITLACPEEKKHVQDIERYIKKQIPHSAIPKFSHVTPPPHSKPKHPPRHRHNKKNKNRKPPWKKDKRRRPK